MSVEAAWDLQAKASPRSLALYPAVQIQSQRAGNNPFDSQPSPDQQQQQQNNNVVAVVFGTDRGSLHYRTYATQMIPSSITTSSSGGIGQRVRRGSESSNALVSTSALQLHLPLGNAARGGKQQQQQLPRHYFPMDLGSLPGPVVACVMIQQQLRNRKQQQQQQQQTFLLLVDDGRGAASQQGTYASLLVASSVATPGFQVLSQQWGKQAQQLPRMSCAFFSTEGHILVYGAGRTVHTLSPELWEPQERRSGGGNIKSKRLTFSSAQLPALGIRSGQDALVVTAGGNVAVAAVGNSFYAILGCEMDGTESADANSTSSSSILKILSFQQSSQVHPVIVIDLLDRSLVMDWSSLFLASGRECAVVDLYCASDHNYSHETALSCSKPRNGTVTVASPILAAAASWPWVALLTSDGLISVRSPSCLAIPLRTVEVGQRPNDYFILRTARTSSSDASAPWIVAGAYSGECKVLQCQPDSVQDLADRLMRHAIDAFGANGFPRAELAEAVNASFTATSYVGPEASPHSRALLKQYLEAILGLADFEAGGSSGWPTELSEGDVRHGTFAGGSTGADLRETFSGRGAAPTVVSSASPVALLTGTALLCLVCSQLSPPNSVLASRAAKSCTERIGIVFEGTGTISKSAIQVCEIIAEKLLREASSNFSLLTGSSPAPIARVHRSSQSSTITDFIESAIWLLRSCGKHERAIEVSYGRLQQQGQQANEGTGTNVRGFWSQIKYESYTATHVSEIWSAGKDEGCRLVLSSPATYRLLESNPRLGLSVFTALHPQNQSQWRAMPARDDPLAQPERVYEVLKLLKSTNPAIPYDKERSFALDDDVTLPLESGRAVAVAFLRSAIGISSGRTADDDEFDSLPMDTEFEEHVANIHDELSFLLLEGVIVERPEGEREAEDTLLGTVYRSMLRELLKWPLAKIRPEHFIESLPPTFLQEKALVLGRVGRHDDALRILYRDLNSLNLALEYCDYRYARQKAQHEKTRNRQQANNLIYTESDPADDFESKEEDNAYLPLVRVALESNDAERGTATAIKVLALRRGAVDRAAALRLLPSDVPVSSVARPFLIPALVDSESQVRRMTVVSALLRSRYLRLKEKLTVAQLKAQANIHVVSALRGLNLGDPLYSTKSIRARTTTPGSTLPYIEIVKHFFPHHLVIQAKVTNVPYLSYSSSSSAAYASSDKNSQTILSDIAFVVAESSEEEAIQPLLHVPIQLLPPTMTGSAWCVLSASPGNMDGPVAQLTCELRYSVQSVDSASAATPMGNAAVMSRTFVEELQDLEVHAAHFSPKLH